YKDYFSSILCSDVNDCSRLGVKGSFNKRKGCHMMKTWRELEEDQPLATKILTNSIKKHRISNAYLIQGDRGTGKKSLAKLLAMTLFCESSDGLEPCQSCPVCQRVDSGNHPDVHWIEPDGNSIKNDQIKLLRKEFAYTGY